GTAGSRRTPSAAAGLYSSLKPRLKSMMISLESKPVLLSMGADIDAQFDMMNLMAGGQIPAPISTIGVAVQAEGGLELIAAVDGRTEQNTQPLQTKAGSLIEPIKEFLESKVDLAID